MSNLINSSQPAVTYNCENFYGHYDNRKNINVLEPKKSQRNKDDEYPLTGNRLLLGKVFMPDWVWHSSSLYLRVILLFKDNRNFWHDFTFQVSILKMCPRVWAQVLIVPERGTRQINSKIYAQTKWALKMLALGEMQRKWKWGRILPGYVQWLTTR